MRRKCFGIGAPSVLVVAWVRWAIFHFKAGALAYGKRLLLLLCEGDWCRQEVQLVDLAPFSVEAAPDEAAASRHGDTACSPCQRE